VSGWQTLRDCLLGLLFLGGFVTFAFIAHRYGQTDLFSKLRHLESESAPVGERGPVSRVLDELVCAILGPTLGRYQSPNHIHPTPQQWMYVVLPTIALIDFFGIFLPWYWAIPAGLGIYGLVLMALIIIERVIEGPGIWWRKRTAGPLNPVAVALLTAFLVLSFLLRIADKVLS